MVQFVNILKNDNQKTIQSVFSKKLALKENIVKGLIKLCKKPSR